MVEDRRAFVVDSDADSRKNAARYLEAMGFSVWDGESGLGAIDAARETPPRVLVVDMITTDVSGLGVCRMVREDPRIAATPIIMVTPYCTEVDRILAFESGADDFLPEPYSGRELQARVAAVMRRSAAARSDDASGFRDPEGVLAIDLARERVHVRNRRADLTRTEFKIVATLVRRAGRVVTREQLLDAVWHGPHAPTSRTIDAHMKMIRRKLGDAHDCLETVRGVGYRLSSHPRPRI
jgi:two-component system phosphate regulon response regulator PhoB